MKITLLTSLISTLVAGWCVFGVLVHGWQILFYPLAWAGVVGVFFVLNMLHDRKAGAVERAKQERPADAPSETGPSKPKTQKSTAVGAQ